MIVINLKRNVKLETQKSSWVANKETLIPWMQRTEEFEDQAQDLIMSCRIPEKGPVPCQTSAKFDMSKHLVEKDVMVRALWDLRISELIHSNTLEPLIASLKPLGLDKYPIPLS